MSLSYEDSFFLYTDFLGTKEICKNSLLDKAALELIEKYSKQNCDETVSEKFFRAAFSSFSDHIVISFSATEEYCKDGFFPHFLSALFKMASDLSRDAIKKGLLMRGVLHTGKIIHKNNIVRGEAFNNATLWESKSVIYPRIVISNELIDFIKKMNPELSSEVPISRDFDGLYYIDYFKALPPFYKNWSRIEDFFFAVFHFFKTIRPHIEKELTKESDFHIKSKWFWIANKFDGAIDFWLRRSESCGQNEFENTVKKFNLTKDIILYDPSVMISQYKIII